MSEDSSSRDPKRSSTTFPEDRLRLVLQQQYQIEGTIHRLPGEQDLNFRIESDSGSCIFKLSHPDSDPELLRLQNAAIELCYANDRFNSPKLVRSRQRQTIVPVTDTAGNVRHARLLRFVSGTPLGEIPANDSRRNMELWHEVGRTIAAVDETLIPLNHHPAARRKFQWDLSGAANLVADSTPARGDDSLAAVLRNCLQNVRAVQDRIDDLPESVIHNDLNDFNLLIDEQPSDVDRLVGESPWIGVIDFGDIVFAKTIFNLAIGLAYSVLDMPDPIQCAAAIVSGYHSARPLTETEISVLFPLMQLRLAQSICISRRQSAADPGNEYLTISQRPAEEMLFRLNELDSADVCQQLSFACFGKSLLDSDDDSGEELEAGSPRNRLLQQRSQRLGPSLSLAYDKPLHLVKGRGQYLYDDSGLTYLDCVNNVCHVGHCHRDVVKAASAQIGLLNTNTRYLHENVLKLAERLAATMPAPLEVCYFVNSGSEANDLALRLARTFTGAEDVCVLDHAYHGHVASLIEISPYKFNSRGGQGRAAHVHVFPIPDRYRGPFGYDDPEAASGYANAGIETLNSAMQNGRKIAAFFAEPIVGCGGQVPLPDGYLKAVYPVIRQHGGVCVSDEVQVGFGRTGSGYWGFQNQQVIPDIVTVGKPFGNGHPLAAVVTTREIADAFDNGMEYFNTFGGNPVSCAVGLAVMDAIENEGLQEHALETGSWILEQLRSLRQTHPVIGDVRGSGFFLGIELVLDRESKRPAAEFTAALINRLREKNILLSRDGPLENVIKFKPPMVFSRANSERLIGALERAFGEIQADYF